MTQLIALTSQKTKKRIQLGSLAAYLVLSISTFLVAFPFWWMLVVASNKKNEIAKNPHDSLWVMNLGILLM